jgi:ferredoxin-thioredoxin reductase catalytic subunit
MREREEEEEEKEKWYICVCIYRGDLIQGRQMEAQVSEGVRV